MSTVNAGRRAANSDLMKGLTRVAFVGYGLMHLALAWLAAQIAFGQSSQEADQSGAFRTLAAQPFGKFLLWFVVICLVVLAVWQLALAVWGHRDVRGKKRIFERASSAVRTIIYAVLAWTAGKVVVGTPSSSAEQQQQTTAGIMSKPAGAWLVALAGLIVLTVGLGMLWYGLKRQFERKLRFDGANPHHARKAAIRAGQIGYAAKGIAFAIVGALLVEAAIKNDPGKSRGLDAALHTLADQPYGKFLLLAVALGVAVFGVYCFFQARYRKVGT
ncbi:DUF1206 domain-containing protein [Dactylosporangium darangshiense]|uniref:DUF1206 domain-containing protein n=2 Tax=Dactylosporangium darangshiense TaxID=579108 RepID=A0ABP8DUY8_9ACTN